MDFILSIKTTEYESECSSTNSESTAAETRPKIKFEAGSSLVSESLFSFPSILAFAPDFYFWRAH